MFKNNLITAESKKVLWYTIVFVCLDALNINSVGKT